MKKVLAALLFTVLAFCSSFSQVLHSYELVYTFSPQQLDSIYNAVGLPAAILPKKYPIEIYRIQYNTVDYDSISPAIASGVICIPSSEFICKASMGVYHHGTIAARSQAPSVNIIGSEAIIGMVMATDGSITLLPDYLALGTGTGTMHPYMHGRSEATATVDMLRAAKELLEIIDVETNGQLFLTGYSQGGHAAMAAARMIQTHFSDEFTITALAPLSGPYSVSGVMFDVMMSDDAYAVPSYLPFLMLSYRMVYGIYQDINNVLKEPYNTVLPPMFDGSNSLSVIDPFVPSTPKNIVIQEVLDSVFTDSSHVFRQILKQNDMFDWIPQFPVFMMYCESDEEVSYINALKTYDKFLENGVDVQKFNLSSELSHYDCAPLALLNTKIWFDSYRTDMLDVEFEITNDVGSQCNGSVIPQITSGVEPLTLQWSGGSNQNLCAGTYTLTITDAVGCVKTFEFEIGNSMSVSELPISNLKLFPNPVSLNLNVELSNIEKPINYRIISVSGKVMSQGFFNQTINSLDVSRFLAGVYILELISDESTNRKIFVKE